MHLTVFIFVALGPLLCTNALISTVRRNFKGFACCLRLNEKLASIYRLCSVSFFFCITLFSYFIVIIFHGPCYVQSVDEHIKSFVTQLQADNPLGVRNVSMDRNYESYDLIQWLLTHNFTTICTMKMNWLSLLDEIKYAKQLEFSSKTIHYEQTENKINLISYWVKNEK